MSETAAGGAFPALEEALSTGALDARRLPAVLGITPELFADVRSGMEYAAVTEELRVRMAAALDVDPDALFARSPATLRLLSTAPTLTAPAEVFRKVAVLTRRAA